MADQPDASHTRWERNRRLIAGLLTIWFGVSFGVSYFARQLDGVMLGWPFSFWVAAQGAQLVYLALVGAYAYWARRHADGDRGDE